MKSIFAVALATSLGVVTVLPAAARADEDEKVVSLDQIPPPAKAALLREAKGVPIRRVEVETQRGTTVYEGVIPQGNQEIGITVDAQGTVLGRHVEKGEKDEHK